jgi:hypothetical protein
MDERLKTGIGDKKNMLLPKKVKVKFVSIKKQKDKSNEEIGEKVVLSCKHPDREELIDISKVKYEDRGKVRYGGLWFKLDKDGKIPFNSALAHLLRSADVTIPSELNNKELDTTNDDDNFIIFKAL